MESVTKNRQPPAVLRAMVARAFGADRVPDGQGWAEELGHGWFNVVYAIRLRDGERVALKIAPPAGVEVMTYERGMLRTEVAALRMIDDRTAVPVPAVLFHDESGELCDAHYFFMRYTDALNLGVIWAGLSVPQQEHYAHLMGWATRQINRIGGDFFGPLSGAAAGKSWRQVFTGMVHDVLADGQRRGVDIGWHYDLVRDLLERYADCLDEVATPVLVEWDLWPSNVLVSDGALVAVIDHERVFYGDPLMEAGFAAPLLGLESFADGSAAGYGRDRRALSAVERLRRRLYDVHLILIMMIETVYRGHADASQYGPARRRFDILMEGFGHRREAAAGRDSPGRLGTVAD